MQIERIRKVLPGDPIEEKGFKCYGIEENRAVIAGTLCRIEDLFFIMSKTKLYVPKKYDIVIGKVIFTSQDFYKIDLGTCTGILPALAFVNATKRNKPDLEKDDCVLCQVEKVSDGDPLLSCKKEGLGKIDEFFQVDSWKIRLMYFNDLLKDLSKDKTFKIALGINGYVWIEGTPDIKLQILRKIDDFNFSDS